MSCSLRMLALLALLVALPASAQTITGTATFRERIALPPNAVFEAVLQDVSRADAGAPVLGRARIAAPLQPPIAFAIPYDSASIRPEARYGVSARIRVGDRLVFATDRLVTVLTRGGGTSVELLLRSVGGAGGSDARPADVSSPVPSPPAQPADADLLGALPAAFAGALPCADCEAIDWELDLLPGGAFRLARSYRGKPERARRDAIGRWRVDAAQRVLNLREAGGEEIRFEIRNRDTLRKRDIAGRPIEARLDYELERRTVYEPIEARLTLDGMYVYLADAPSITLCATGERLPVAMEEDNVALERGYAALRKEPGEVMLVTIEARIAQRPGMDGGAPRASVVPARFVGAWPRESCSTLDGAASLQETYWRLTRLRETPVEAAPRQREPHLVFRGEGGRLAGSGGCNRLVGGYTRTLEQLDISGIGLTRMACPAGMEQEARFAAALADVARWRIRGRHLDLFDVGGTRILRFEAAALR